MQLGLAVHVGWAERRGLVQRLVAGGIDRRGGGEDQARDARAAGGLDQGERVADVVEEVLAWVAHAFAGLDEGRKMHDGLEAALAQRAAEQPAPSARSAWTKSGLARHRGAVPGEQRVVHRDAVPGLEQHARAGRPDVTRTAAHQYVH